MNSRIYNRIARRITARSQMVKTCMISGRTALFHIEESIFINDGEYKCSDFFNDVNGFNADVTAEMNSIGFDGLKTDDIIISSDSENGLLVLSIEIKKPVDEKIKESIRQHEWIVDEK